MFVCVTFYSKVKHDCFFNLLSNDIWKLATASCFCNIDSSVRTASPGRELWELTEFDAYVGGSGGLCEAKEPQSEGYLWEISIKVWAFAA